MTTMELSARQQLERVAAHRRLDERSIYRAIARAARDGLKQREISDIIGNLSQATVQRIIQRITADPSLLQVTPTEIIDRRAAGLISDDTMMGELLNWRYDFGSVPRIDGVATDAYISGDWDEIESAYYRDQLSDEEFAALSDRQQQLISQVFRS
ncbi:winged helix-turn-helix domain-containing protein [Mycolicibacterium sp. BK634]|uniref:winged helix-turn-helix domain-containing protein n=1 Tax=Mycolicibacterium sp. BK634 TaxID=2587099 RepID=UPI00351D8822